jgi:hypothetical protein
MQLYGLLDGIPLWVLFAVTVAENLEQAISRSEELHRLLWSQAIATREKTSSPIFAG